MSTILNSSWKISGVIDSSKSVSENIDTLATASGCWATFDIGQGKWAVIINQAGTSVKSFNDSNIIGSITVSGSDLNELYNSVQVDFPHKDLLDQKDTIVYSIPTANRFSNEQDNTLNFAIDCVNEPVQIEALAIRELKQTRIDKIVKFRTDFTSIDLKAGDLIDVTATMYGFSSKVFRILSISEEDGDDGSLALGITAFEYDSAVYDTSDISRQDRTPINNIVDLKCNETAKTKDDINTGSALLRLLGTTMVTNWLTSAFVKNPLTGVVSQILSPKNATLESNVISAFTEAPRAEILKKLKIPLTVSGPTSICEGETLSLVIGTDCDICLIDSASTIDYPYTITGVQAADITFPLTGNVKIGDTVNIPIATDASAETETLVFTVQGTAKSVTINDRLAFTYVTTASPSSVTEGSSSTVTLTTTGVADGTSVPYTITGSGTGRVSTALTGTVTVNSNSATLTVATTNDSVYTGDQTVTVTFNAGQADPCGQLDKTAAITIQDNETAPTTCLYVSVPVIWCGQYNGNDNQLEGVTVEKTVMLPKALAGEATVNVPKTLTVTKGNPSTITVATTEAVASSALLGGFPIQVITTFNTVATNGLITGSATTTVYGY